MKKIYIAAPYSSKDKEIMRMRYELVTNFAAELMKQGNIVFSSITHSHPIAQYIGNALDRDFWLKQDFEFLAKCNQLAVLKLEGWENSIGLKKEIDFAMDRNIEIVYYELGFNKVV